MRVYSSVTVLLLLETIIPGRHAAHRKVVQGTQLLVFSLRQELARIRLNLFFVVFVFFCDIASRACEGRCDVYRPPPGHVAERRSKRRPFLCFSNTVLI